MNIPPHNIRYYQVPPDQKSVMQCESHGSDHKSYGWCPKIDPRWSDEQAEAYLFGYNTTPRNP
jgi:hypothetical protein